MTQFSNHHWNCYLGVVDEPKKAQCSHHGYGDHGVGLSFCLWGVSLGALRSFFPALNKNL
jgi:hypothetical protein